MKNQIKNQKKKELELEMLLALEDLFGDIDDDDDDDDNDDEDPEPTPTNDGEYNRMLIDLNSRTELQTLVHRLVPHCDQEDAWSEFLMQVATIKNKQKVLDVWNKNNREFHWYMVRVICNQLKSKTSHYYRQYRRPQQHIDDNSHNIISVANGLGGSNDTFDGYVFESIENQLTHDDDTETTMDQQMIMDEVNYFVNNFLTFYEREIYKMYYEEELSHVKISKATRIPATSIGNTVRGVLAMIQLHLENIGIVNDNNNI